jgi:hypothetical protein
VSEVGGCCWLACLLAVGGRIGASRASARIACRPDRGPRGHSEPDRLSLSRSIVCRQKPQKENSGGKFGWGKIQPLLKAGAGLID